MKLAKTNIIFDAVSHTYTLDDNILHGITGVIKDKLFPNEYDNVPESVLNRAAERGSRIHKVLEMFDLYNITTEHCPELENYTKAVSEYPFLANHVTSEYLVTDGEKYASAIDKIYEDGKGGVILADIKTTYKLNKEYVAWQLSIYSYFFEQMNPDIHVGKLYAIWLREDKFKIVEVARKETKDIETLLYSDDTPITTDDNTFNDEELVYFKVQADEAKKAYDQKKLEVQNYMVGIGAKQIAGNLCKVTMKEDSERISFDTKRFKADHPDLYEEYITKSTIKGGLLITINK